MALSNTPASGTRLIYVNAICHLVHPVHRKAETKEVCISTGGVRSFAISFVQVLLSIPK